MNLYLTQLLQQKLNRYFNQLTNVDIDIFVNLLNRFLIFIESDQLLASIISQLQTDNPGANQCIGQADRESLIGENESEAAAIGYCVLKECKDIATTLNYAARIGCYIPNYINFDIREKHKSTIIQSFLTPFCNYLNDYLDEQKVMLYLLLKYKHRSEWFYRNQLCKIYEDETNNKTRKAEKTLALDLYAYLFEQGLEFTIEPSSIDGEIDLIAAQNSDDPLLADAKIFDSKGRNKTYICKGFNQLYTYTQQYNEPFGYLVIYKATDKDLRFSLSTASQNVPFISYNHKTIFFIVIDIYEHPKPVSQRGKLQAETITEEDLVKTITTEE